MAKYYNSKKADKTIIDAKTGAIVTREFTSAEKQRRSEEFAAAEKIREEQKEREEFIKEKKLQDDAAFYEWKKQRKD